MGVRNDAQDYFPWWWDASLGGGFATSTQGGGGGTTTTTGGAVGSIAAAIAALMAKGYTREAAERYLREKTYPHKAQPQTQTQTPAQTIPWEQRLSLEVPKGVEVNAPHLRTLPQTQTPAQTIPWEERLSLEVPKAGTQIGTGKGHFVPELAIPEAAQDVYPEIKIPWEERLSLEVPKPGTQIGTGNVTLPTPGDVAIPTPGDVAIPTPGDVAIPTPGDVAIPRPGDVAIPKPKTNVIAKPGEEVISKTDKDSWETKNLYPPMIEPAINTEKGQGEELMTELPDKTNENIDYPIDYSGLEAWLMQQQQRMWDREDQIRKETQEREDTAYQRAVADARKAGINVNLMDIQPAESGGGISTATGIYSGMLENAMSGHSNRYINSMNVGSNEYIAQLNNATKLMEAQINNNFKGDENDKQRFLDLVSEIISSAAMIFAFKKGSK